MAQAQNRGIDGKVIQSMRQLQAAPGYPWVIRPLDAKRNVDGDLMTRFIEPFGLRRYQSGHNQGLRAGAAFREAPFHEQLVETAFGGFGHAYPAGPDQAQASCDRIAGSASPARPSAARTLATICEDFSPAISHWVSGLL